MEKQCGFMITRFTVNLGKTGAYMHTLDNKYQTGFTNEALHNFHLGSKYTELHYEMEGWISLTASTTNHEVLNLELRGQFH